MIENSWVEVPNLASLLGVTERAVRLSIERGKFTQVRQVNGNGVGRGGKIWQVNITDSAIPPNARHEFFKLQTATAAPLGNPPGEEPPTLLAGEAFLRSFPANILSEDEIDAEFYAAAPEYARRKADKYIQIIKASEGLRGDELKEFIAVEWNRKHPNFKTSYPRVIESRKAYEEQGIAGLLAKYGKATGTTSVKDEWFEYFKAAYLKEGAPSLRSCWVKVVGFARPGDPELKVSEFPSPKAFLRRLEKEIPEDAIFIARYGEKAWNKKYANYINRDYSNILPGECIVSDHAQVDVAVELPNGKYVFPWVTVWRDFRTGKWLGWTLHSEAPSSDHVFQSFYYAARDFGLPSDVLIDNGKDYRCRDFAGGRKNIKVTIDDGKTSAMLALLNITPHFSLPYNAQTKPIERDFLKAKEAFSKHMPGYRGGNVTERPEKLAKEIKTGGILRWDDFVKCMDDFIRNVLNKMPSNGKVLQGRCPDEAWAAEHKERRVVSKDALKLFCMRTSRPLTIGRNGVRDSEAGVMYWGEWMAGMKGEKVYLRRDLKSYQEAWVFRAENDEYLGKALIAESAAALAKTDIEKAQLKDLLAQKNRAKNITISFLDLKDIPTPSDSLAPMAAGVEALNEERGYTAKDAEVKTLKVLNTAMDKVVQEEKRQQREGTYDLSSIQPPGRQKEPLFLYQYEKEAYEKSLNKTRDEDQESR